MKKFKLHITLAIVAICLLAVVFNFYIMYEIKIKFWYNAGNTEEEVKVPIYENCGTEDEQIQAYFEKWLDNNEDAGYGIIIARCNF